MILRSQLPAYSPLSLSALGRAAVSGLKDPGHSQQALEGRLRELFGQNRTVLTGSGTHALTLAIQLAHGQSGNRRPIGLPSYGCFDLATAAIGARTRVLFYDVDPETLDADLGSVAEILHRGASAVIASPLFGFPMNWGALKGLCRDADAVLIEDAAQGLWNSWEGKKGGTFGDLTILSFGRGKGWTGGRGGALLIRGGQLGPGAGLGSLPPIPRIEALRSALLTFAQWTFGRPLLFGIPSSIPGLGLGETHYREPTPPARIPNLSASLALRTLCASMSEIDERKRNAFRLNSTIQDRSSTAVLVPIHPAEGGDATFLRLPALLKSGDIDFPETRLWKRLGIRRGYPTPLPNLEPLKALHAGPASTWSGGERLAARLVTLPTHSLLDESDLTRLEHAVSSRSRGQRPWPFVEKSDPRR